MLMPMLCRRHLEDFRIHSDRCWSGDDLGLSSFPGVLCELPKLNRIDMTQQLLIDIPVSLSDLKELTYLQL